MQQVDVLLRLCKDEQGDVRNLSISPGDSVFAFL